MTQRVVRCSSCRAAHRVDESRLGNIVSCGSCGAPFVLARDDQTGGQSQGWACPACGEMAAAVAVLCVACGFDKRKGRKTAAEPHRTTPSGNSSPNTGERDAALVARACAALPIRPILNNAVVGTLAYFGYQFGNEYYKSWQRDQAARRKAVRDREGIQRAIAKREHDHPGRCCPGPEPPINGDHGRATGGCERLKVPRAGQRVSCAATRSPDIRHGRIRVTGA